MMATIKANNSAIKIKAFTAVEIDYFARISGLSVEDVISELKRLGLDSTPGAERRYLPRISAIRSARRRSLQSAG